LVEFSKKQVNF